MPVGRALRRSAAIAALAGVATLGSAGAFTGDSSAGGAPTSAAPDLVSATIVRTVEPSEAQGPQARLCYDAALDPASIVAADFWLTDYDARIAPRAVAAAISPDDARCLIGTFADGLDITQMSVASGGPPDLRDTGGHPAPLESAPLLGSASELTSATGTTTAPDLVSAARVGSTAQFDYVFDERLDPALASGGPALAAKFGFYREEDDGGAPLTGTDIVAVSGKRITVAFDPSADLSGAKSLFVAPTGAGDDPRDRIPGAQLGSGRSHTSAPVGSTGDVSGSAPGLIAAVKQADPRSVVLTFAQPIVPGTGAVVAYRADATPLTGTYAVGTTAEATKLQVTLPEAAATEPGSVVLVAVAPGVAVNQAGHKSAWGAAAIGTEPMRPGRTDAPDLLSGYLGEADRTATYVFDEPVAPGADAARFGIIDSGGSTRHPLPGPLDVCDDPRRVQVRFADPVSASSTAGLVSDAGAVADTTGSPAPVGAVGLLIYNGSSAPVFPPCHAAASTPTPTAASGHVVFGAAVSLHRRRDGRRFTGTVTAPARCRTSRTVRLYRAGERLATTRTTDAGAFAFSVARQRRHTVRARVAARTVTPLLRCRAAASLKA